MDVQSDAVSMIKTNKKKPPNEGVAPHLLGRDKARLSGSDVSPCYGCMPGGPSATFSTIRWGLTHQRARDACATVLLVKVSVTAELGRERPAIETTGHRPNGMAD